MAKNETSDNSHEPIYFECNIKNFQMNKEKDMKNMMNSTCISILEGKTLSIIVIFIFV